MSKKKQEEKHLNAKQRAYEMHQAKEGAKVVKWIFGVLTVLALIYMAYTMYLMY